jgi:hypothetical protein
MPPGVSLASLSSEIYLPAIDFELSISSNPDCGWVESFFPRLSGARIESLTISRFAIAPTNMTDAQWSAICLWVKDVAVGLKRLVISGQSLSKTALAYIKSAIKNTKSPLIEIDILWNEFENKTKASLDSSKEFVKQIIAERSKGQFNFWEQQREYKVRFDTLFISEGDLRSEV